MWLWVFVCLFVFNITPLPFCSTVNFIVYYILQVFVSQIYVIPILTALAFFHYDLNVFVIQNLRYCLTSGILFLQLIVFIFLSKACMSKYSAGCIYYYPSFHCTHNPSQAEKLQKDLKRYLTRKIGFEAVMRIRCTKGTKL